MYFCEWNAACDDIACTYENCKSFIPICDLEFGLRKTFALHMTHHVGGYGDALCQVILKSFCW